jgi:dihydrofolate synthase/folylpolyglutamate synthase
MDYPALIERLSHRGLFHIKPGLERIRQVLQALGNPQERYPVIHIAGTNGKGSVAASLESILRQSGLKTALYTSPHLIDVRERIQINRQSIGIASFWETAQSVFEAERTAGCTLTYFEFLTAMAFESFSRAGVGVAVIEAGMGGRWDATNVTQKPQLAIITSVGLDHTQWLGKTESAIAREKAGIIKPGVPLVMGVRGPAAKVVAETARKQTAAVYAMGSDFAAVAGEVDWEKHLQTVRYQSRLSGTRDLKTALLGGYQIENAAITFAAIEVLSKIGWAIAPAAVLRGLEQVQWPGRFHFQRSPQGPTVLLDGAHNPPAIKSLLDAIAHSPWKQTRTIFVFSVYRDKDYQRMLKLIRPAAAQVVICGLTGTRALAPRQIAKTLPANLVRIVADPHKALQTARSLAGPNGLVVATGSLSLIGLLLQQQAAHVSEYAYA